MNFNSIEDVRNLTKSNLIGNLQKYGVCAMIRGTGFGKTWLLADIATRYKKICFLYPHNIVAETFERRYTALKGHSDNIDCLTYYGLAVMTHERIKKTFKDYDLIIADECHKLGATKVSENYRYLCSITKAHRILTTATPVRTSDTFDVVKEFADGHEVFPFTLADMIMSDFVKKPHYAEGIYTEDNALVEPEVVTEEYLRAKRVFNAPENIRKTCDDSLTDEEKESMTFICYYTTVENLAELSKKVQNWFRKAFKDKKYKINNINIHSHIGIKENDRTLNKLMTMSREKNTITLIHSIDMLNLGYHIKELTGIVMLRSTSSNIIYTQQLGRVFDTADFNSNKIVFDFVQNVDTESLFKSDNLKAKPMDLDITEFDKFKEMKDNGTITELEYNGIITNYIEKCRSKEELQKAYLEEDEENSGSIKNSNIVHVGRNLSKNNVYMEISVVEAKKYIKRAVVKSENAAIIRDINIWFYRWCKENNIVCPLTDDDLEKYYDKTFEDCKKWLISLFKRVGKAVISEDTPNIGRYLVDNYIKPYGKYKKTENILDLRRYALLDGFNEDYLMNFLYNVDNV